MGVIFTALYFGAILSLALVIRLTVPKQKYTQFKKWINNL